MIFVVMAELFLDIMVLIERIRKPRAGTTGHNAAMNKKARTR